jgi:short-subunit dehydrogenase
MNRSTGNSPQTHALKNAKRYGTWAVVTGASDGIGKAFAEALCQRRFNVVLVARREAALMALALELEKKYGSLVSVIPADLGHGEDIHKVIEETKELDVGMLVSAAGFGTSGTFISNSITIERDMLQVNCTSSLELSWHFAKRFVSRGGGGIVLFSSVMAFQGSAHSANYAATKAYIQTLAEGLHLELKPLGVDVLSCAPGPVNTGFAARAGMNMGKALTPDVIASQSLNALGKQITIRPGWLSKLLGWSLATMPRWGRLKVMSQIMKGMSQAK